MKADKVRALVARGDREAALDGLIAAWQHQPATEIAEAIDALDALDTKRPPTWRQPILLTSSWLKLAKAATRERGALLREIHGRTLPDTVACVEAAARWRDPRLFAVVRTLLETLPWSGRRSTGSWRAIFEVLAALGDPRMHVLVEALPPTWTVGKPMQTFLTNQLRAAAARTPPPVSLPAYAGVATAAGSAAAPKPRSRSTATEAELLAAIREAPEDDGPRLVYADWLQEREAPRGEFIALQLARARDAPPTKRERALLKQHGRAWLGPIAKAVGAAVEWQRGFPAKGVVQLRNQRDAETYGTDPSWATFEELEWNISSTVRADQRVWAGYIGPAMRGLRVAHRPNHRLVLDAKAPWSRLETLGLDAKTLGLDGLRAVLAARAVLPKLRSLWVVGSTEPAWLDGLTWTPPRLEVNTSLEYDEMPVWLAAAARLPTLESFLIHGYPRYRCTFSRGANRALTQLAIEVDLFGTDTLDDAPRYVTELRSAVAKFSKRYANQRTAVAIDRRGVRTPFSI